MPTPPLRIGRPSKVVVAGLDGTRLKGYIFNFSASRTEFRLFPEEMSPHVAGKEMKLETVKAVFFVKDFDGRAEHQDHYELKAGAHGRKLEVTFQDGEKIAGTSEAFHADKPGFFMVPADPGSNNSRIFVVNKSVSEVKLL